MSINPATLTFLRKLKRNNDRDWFKSHATEWEAARADFLALIAALKPGIEKVSDMMFVDDAKSGGSMLRIHRDVRFSKDKSPYKTNLAAVFAHLGVEGKMDAPCFYLQVMPGGKSFVAAGLYGPDSTQLKRIRTAIADDPAAWRKATAGKAFRDRLALVDGALKRPPKGFDPDHPAIEELKRKRFAAASTEFSDDDVCAPDFEKKVVAHFRAAAPLVRFVCDALELPF
ncbi:MAG: DUF2461 domain-containing protein [Planctomycetota bacterium]